MSLFIYFVFLQKCFGLAKHRRVCLCSDYNCYNIFPFPVSSPNTPIYPPCSSNLWPLFSLIYVPKYNSFRPYSVSLYECFQSCISKTLWLLPRLLLGDTVSQQTPDPLAKNLSAHSSAVFSGFVPLILFWSTK